MSKLGPIRKPVRTISGITPLTVVLKPRKCDHGTCIYCPGGDYTPQSYTDKSPAIMRALALKFDPYEQTINRLNTLKKMGHPTDKIEIIILGGTFLQYDIDYQYEFIKRIFDALNGKDAKNLEDAKKINETAEHRCIAMCIENRPDNCSSEEIKRMLEFGATRVEIGVQILDDVIYKKIARGHKVKDVIDATKNLKNAGFKVGYHIMPGLPYSNPKKDLKLFRKIFSDQKFRPDQLKIYPCQIVKDSPLEKMYQRIGYMPYSNEQTREILSRIMRMIPEYCRVMRVMREIPKEKMVVDPLKLDLRKDVEEKLRNSGVKIKEIRMREIGFNLKSSKLGQISAIGFNIRRDIDENLKLKIVSYQASDGEEYFLEIVNKDNLLFGLLRLRIFDEDIALSNFLLPKARDINGSEQVSLSSSLKKDVKSDNAINLNSKYSEQDKNDSNTKTAIIRELHVYGQSLKLGEKSEKASQHQGLGKWLMGEAEKISRKKKVSKIKIISGVGVREYYKKLGYELEDTYMVKEIL
ncbi:tRNA uridine(34) 5-carboxymethylaminomethyl modification radical SAM/GNAT enzyme Elp3 [Candidatus Pacearchaeota archaeon]|nr:tRNA uridine(34) 5-carboxymethylaminomethyl modification radical SAM/GNAT enzyme Elp3 [Candidatus Pacearchaeota archaeon]